MELLEGEQWQLAVKVGNWSEYEKRNLKVRLRTWKLSEWITYAEGERLRMMTAAELKNKAMTESLELMWVTPWLAGENNEKRWEGKIVSFGRSGVFKQQVDSSQTTVGNQRLCVSHRLTLKLHPCGCSINTQGLTVSSFSSPISALNEDRVFSIPMQCLVVVTGRFWVSSMW